MAAVRVFFVHGLEGHPNGSKVRALREQGFEVHAADMYMSLTQLGKKNSAVRFILRLTETRIVISVAVLASAAFFGLAGVAAALFPLLLAMFAVYLRRRALLALALGRSFDACLEIQRQALREQPPDVLVGSSWGGAIAAALVVEGAWQGPTILLAPALTRVAAWTRRRDLSELAPLLRERSEQTPIVVFHDETDASVPYADSEQLALGSHITLRTVEAGGHRLLGLLETGELADTITELVADPA